MHTSIIKLKRLIMAGIAAYTYPEWWPKLTGQAAHWSTDYSTILKNGQDKLISDSASSGQTCRKRSNGITRGISAYRNGGEAE